MASQTRRIFLHGLTTLAYGAFLEASDERSSASEPQKSWFNGLNLEGWRPSDPSAPNDWRVCGGVALNPSDASQFSIQPGRGILVNGDRGETVHLISDLVHRDVRVQVDFNVPKESNSGVYFMGRYEVQILDSYGKETLTHRDCGGIFSRSRQSGGFQGSAPRANASRKPGEWQSLDVTFRAPRFEANGRKRSNAQFLKVVHNGVLVQQGIEVDGPTEGAVDEVEKPVGPLMLQGNHGPVAFRNLRVRRLP
jgi:hypothetical protein